MCSCDLTEVTTGRKRCAMDESALPAMLFAFALGTESSQMPGHFRDCTAIISYSSL